MEMYGTHTNPGRSLLLEIGNGGFWNYLNIKFKF